MARPSFWVREPNPPFFWPKTPLTILNQSLAHAWNPGETIIRIVGNMRFWVNPTAAAITNPEELYASYVWGLVWDDGSVPGISTMTLHGNMDALEEHILHMEAFSMRDAWTPASYNGVNIGFIDDRPETGFDARARRRADPVPPKELCQIRVLASGQSVNDFFPINFSPRCSISVLTLAASTV